MREVHGWKCRVERLRGRVFLSANCELRFPAGEPEPRPIRRAVSICGKGHLCRVRAERNRGTRWHRKPELPATDKRVPPRESKRPIPRKGVSDGVTFAAMRIRGWHRRSLREAKARQGRCAFSRSFPNCIGSRVWRLPGGGPGGWGARAVRARGRGVSARGVSVRGGARERARGEGV